MRVIPILLAVTLVGAQENQKMGSVHGIVRSHPDGMPIPDIPVRIGQTDTRTDSSGAYSLRDLPPGPTKVVIGGPFRDAVFSTEWVTIAPGDAVQANFFLPVRATLSGKVLDHNDEPVPGIEVVLIGREYGSGALHHFRRNVSRTNDEGEYRMEYIQPDVAYLLLFRKHDGRKIKPVSELPAQPQLRRPAVIPTYYPGVADREGASTISLRSGEHREGVNIRLLRAPSYCLEGLLTSGGQPASMTFQIHESHISFGMGPNGGVTGLPLMGESASDGRIRICDLHTGDYRLTAFTGNINTPREMSTIGVTIRDRDVRNVTLQPTPGLPPIPVEVTWVGEPPKHVDEIRIGVSLASLTRSFGGYPGAAPASVGSKLEIANRDPGMSGVFMDDYYLRLIGLSGSLYVQEVFYGTENITHAPLRVGSAIGGSSVRIALGHDGGFVSGQVTDKKGKPTAHAAVVVMPALTSSAGEFAAKVQIAKADQNGEYKTRALKPGKYFALALRSGLGSLTPEIVDTLQAMRLDGREVTLAPNATLEVNLEVLAQR